MRGLLLVSAVTVGLAALASVETPAPDLPPALAASVAAQTFRLVSGEAECSIHRNTTGPDGVSRISLDPDCGAELPLLASADSWRDNADGSISLVGAGGRSLIEFAPADGEGYESFGQGAPLASLHQAD
jgi:hypothetical protein